MRVLACGSRTFEDQAVESDVLMGLHSGIGDDPEFVIIEGGARGADAIARSMARAFRWEVESYPAEWDVYGKRAGYLRNRKMLEEGLPDLVVAFVDKPLEESKGTRMMVDLAREAGVKTIVVEVR